MSKNNDLNHGTAPAYIAAATPGPRCPNCGHITDRDATGFLSCRFCTWDSYDCGTCSNPMNGRDLRGCLSEVVGTHDCRGTTHFLSPTADSIIRVVASLAAAIAIGAAIALWRL